MGEVDKVKTALKEFIKVIAEANKKNEAENETYNANEKIMSIVGYLEDSDMQQMDIQDDIFITPTNQEHLPGIVDALRGKGST